MKSGRNFSGYCRGAVGVRAARDERVDAVGAHVGEHLQVAAGLRRRVRTRRRGSGVLAARRRPERDVPVHLVGRDLNVAKAVPARVVEQHLRAEDVGEDELGRPEDRAVDVRLGREVDDRRRSRAAAARPRRRRRCRPVELVLDAVEVRAVARVRELVEDDDLVALRGETPRERRADEARSACDENPHRGTGYASATAEPLRGRRAARRASAAARVRPSRCAAPSTPAAAPARRTRRS